MSPVVPMAQKELQIGHKLINTTMECTHIYYINAGMKFACTYVHVLIYALQHAYKYCIYIYTGVYITFLQTL